MHAAGAAGAIVAISDCGQENPIQPFYGGSCVGDQCGVVMTDSGADANDANGTVFYGAPCLDGSCLPPQDAGTDGSEASGDASEDVEDAGTRDGAGDGPGGD
jgi:hypothetical protein